MHYLAVNPIGIFVFDEKNKLVKFKYLGSNPEESARKLDMFERGEAVEDIQELKNEFEDLVTEQPNKATDFLRENFRKIVTEEKLFKSENELNQLLNAVLIAKSKLSISKIEKRQTHNTDSLCPERSGEDIEHNNRKT